MSAHRTPEEIRKSLKHPVIDGDGHWVEYPPVFGERMRKVVGDKGADGFIASQRRIPDALSVSIADRKARGTAMEGYWGRQSTNTLDRATAMLPALMHRRLDELGIDFALLYPTYGLTVTALDDAELRQAAARAFNRSYAELYAGHRDRLERPDHRQHTNRRAAQPTPDRPPITPRPGDPERGRKGTGQ